MRRKTVLIAAAALCELFFLAQPAEGALITISIRGKITYVNDSADFLQGKIHVDDTITGIYTYDRSTVDLVPYDPHSGMYVHYEPPCGIHLSAGGFDFRSDPDDMYFVVRIGDNIRTHVDSYDLYKIGSWGNLPIATGGHVYEISWVLRDNSRNANSSDQLPTTAPVLDDWKSQNYLYVGSGDFQITARITEATLIPEPSMLVLFGLGALALLRKRRFAKTEQDER